MRGINNCLKSREVPLVDFKILPIFSENWELLELRRKVPHLLFYILAFDTNQRDCGNNPSINYMELTVYSWKAVEFLIGIHRYFLTQVDHFRLMHPRLLAYV